MPRKSQNAAFENLPARLRLDSGAPALCPAIGRVVAGDRLALTLTADVMQACDAVHRDIPYPMR